MPAAVGKKRRCGRGPSALSRCGRESTSPRSAQLGQLVAQCGDRCAPETGQFADGRASGASQRWSSASWSSSLSERVGEVRLRDGRLGRPSFASPPPAPRRCHPRCRGPRGAACGLPGRVRESATESDGRRRTVRPCARDRGTACRCRGSPRLPRLARRLSLPVLIQFTGHRLPTNAPREPPFRSTYERYSDAGKRMAMLVDRIQLTAPLTVTEETSLQLRLSALARSANRHTGPDLNRIVPSLTALLWASLAPGALPCRCQATKSAS